MTRRRLAGAVLPAVAVVAAAVVTATGTLDTPAAAGTLNVYAATSLTKVLPEIDRAPAYAFGGSNTLQLQIEHGAPADLFLSASPQEAQALYAKGRCTRPVTFATNRLVLITRKGDPRGIRTVYGLRRGGLNLAIGNAAVPVGDYTRRLLRRLRLSSVLNNNRVSQQSNVGQVLAQVVLGGADAGFVYATDARTEPGRVARLPVPRWAQTPVQYQACIVRRKGGDGRGAQRLLDQIRSRRGRQMLKRFGFGLPRH